MALWVRVPHHLRRKHVSPDVQQMLEHLHQCNTTFADILASAGSKDMIDALEAFVCMPRFVTTFPVNGVVCDGDSDSNHSSSPRENESGQGRDRGTGSQDNGNRRRRQREGSDGLEEQGGRRRRQRREH